MLPVLPGAALPVEPQAFEAGVPGVPELPGVPGPAPATTMMTFDSVRLAPGDAMIP
jgi:hypothetical protein